MDNDMNFAVHFDEVEIADFEVTVAIYNDLGCPNMNLIGQIQQ